MNTIHILVGMSLAGLIVACATNTNTAMQTPDAGASTPLVATPAVQVVAVPVVVSAKGAEISATSVPESAKTDAVREPVAVVESRPTRTVAELAAQLHKDRRALYVSSEESYQFYIGGVLKAKYFPDDQKLVLLDMSGGQSQPCNYQLDGRLQAKTNGKNAADMTKSCAELVGKLNESLPN
jgi:hypothetical protein